MGKYLLKLPKMGESIAEATITKWLKDVGDTVEIDESLVEIATDKVDSDVPSEYKGKLIKKNFEVDDIVKVGEVIAEIETEMIENDQPIIKPKETKKEIIQVESDEKPSDEIELDDIPSLELLDKENPIDSLKDETKTDKFYSPLVKNIAKKEKISNQELDSIVGSGKDGRVTKQDILSYVSSRSNNENDNISAEINSSREDQTLELDRMGKIIFDHMSNSKKISAHVQSFIEVDVTKIWEWREGIKFEFQKKYAEKITFTPIFMEAVASALAKHPMLNVSVDGESIIKHKDINLGMATALNDGNLIVPVIKQADQLNLIGMVKRVNDLAHRARENKLNPDDIKGGTYTVTNAVSYTHLTLPTKA